MLLKAKTQNHMQNKGNIRDWQNSRLQLEVDFYQKKNKKKKK